MNSRLRNAIVSGFADPWAASVLWKDSPSPPPPPDYGAAARAQGEANVEAARIQGRLSNPNIITPYGSQTVTWGTPGGGTVPSTAPPPVQQSTVSQGPREIDIGYEGYGQGDGYVDYRGQGDDMRAVWVTNAAPAVQQMQQGSQGATPMAQQPMAQQPQTAAQNYADDQPTVTRTFSPEQQELYNQQTEISKRLGLLGLGGLEWLQKTVDEPLDLSGVTGFAEAPVANEATRKAVSDAILARQQPAMQQKQDELRTQLITRGFRPGTEAWAREWQRLGTQENDLRMAADMAGGQEMQRVFGMGLQGAQFQNTQRGQQIQEALLKRRLPLEELNALRTGAMPSLPQFQNYQGSTVAPAPVFGAAQAQYGAQADAYNAQAAQSGNFMNGLFQLGAAALPVFF
jgi:hypothetical protein